MAEAQKMTNNKDMKTFFRDQIIQTVLTQMMNEKVQAAGGTVS